MKSHKLPINPVDVFVAPMLNLPAWGVKKGHGSFLTFEFGEPKLEVVESKLADGKFRRNAHVHGDWHLWIYCCNWRIFQLDEQIAWSESDDKLIGKATAILNGQKLTSVTVEPQQGSSAFIFDLGGKLETWSYGDDPTDEQWMFYGPAKVLGYRADGKFSLNRADAQADYEG
ncbi:hypothetical protein HUO14_05285 [Parasphingorhabdus flavimaris]|uniref:Uncharacterized protein n=1 Tax=Parasphingorhabdus flavimaris TaxID=266812 RepID=A0ABX2N105_9SPHN|nr:hypothetical protein [Parasphingorhabdus flavimaris]NVD27313.1 hypothetical protein [Parasphingorhabdus flavimaris]|tara:strand:- start:1442 stop:1957 length:516 start_codon:yes stop_codon:yes gene_type:complete